MVGHLIHLALFAYTHFDLNLPIAVDWVELVNFPPQLTPKRFLEVYCWRHALWEKPVYRIVSGLNAQCTYPDVTQSHSVLLVVTQQ